METEKNINQDPTNMHIKVKRKIIVCFMVPRSRSSFFWRLMYNFDNSHCFFEPLRCVETLKLGDRKFHEELY